MKKLDAICIGLILLVALTLRLYKLDSPLIDFHSFRQADTAAVARNMARDGFDMLHPKFDDISNLASGQENPKGYRMVEFPIYNASFALLYKYIPVFPVEVWGRIVSIIASLGTIALLYVILLRSYGRLAAAAAGVTYAIMPFFVYFSRVVLPESTAVFFATLGMFFVLKVEEVLSAHKIHKKKVIVYTALMAISFATALLIKPPTIFFAALGTVVLLAKLFMHEGESKSKQMLMFVFIAGGLLCLVPMAIWRQYILAYPEGIPANSWLITSVQTAQGEQTIFMRPAFFRWIFGERLNIILGTYLIPFALSAFFIKPRFLTPVGIFVASIAYVFVFQGGNVQHEYYQALVLPALACATGAGVQFVASLVKSIWHKLALGIAIIGMFAFAWFLSYYTVQNYYYSVSDIPQMATLIKQITTPADRIVTDTQGDTTVLYAFDRKGAGSPYRDIPELQKLGYTYFFTYNLEYAADLQKKYNVKAVLETNKFVLLKL